MKVHRILACAVAIGGLSLCTVAAGDPAPLLAKGKAVDWFFVYKFNAKSFPQCAGGAQRSCPFGGSPVNYRSGFGQQYVVASSDDASLQSGGAECLGDTTDDPVGSTFDQIYNGSLFYVIWNDQFYNDPKIAHCGTSCPSPWGHSKGVLAWDDQGNGVLLQVTTPSWPASGSASHPRGDGNSLGCVTDDNVLVGQHFFSVRLTADDVVAVARALANASIVTDPQEPQIVNNGGPQAIRDVVATLGTKSDSEQVLWSALSSGVSLISKPSAIYAPPWHLVSSLLGSADLLVASWWNHNDIPDTVAGETPGCWPQQDGWNAPGAVVNAQSGHWDTTTFSLLGVGNASGNHAKIGVSTSGPHPYTILGDMNQEGSLSGSCAARQNGRGGVFFVVEDQNLHDSVLSLISNSQPRAPSASRRLVSHRGGRP
jgi:hypothetical protein